MYYFIVYKITNLVNFKIYIGCHKTKDLTDDYMGSGKLIKRAIKKYGIDNFKKDILAIFNSSDEMYEYERQLVNVCSESYNLKKGGEGGFDYINANKLGGFKGKKHTVETKNKISEKSKQRSEEYLKKISERMKGNCHNPKIKLKGKEHPASKSKSDEHKKKISETIKKRWEEKKRICGSSPGRGLSLPS